MSIAVQVAIVMVILLVVMLAAGIPIGVGIGLSSAVSMICMLQAMFAFATSAQRIFAGSNSFSLIAIPFFILAGNIMNNGGHCSASCQLCQSIRRKNAWFPGTGQRYRKHALWRYQRFWRCCCGGYRKYHGPLEEKEGYGKNYSVAVNVASAPVGMLIPPSNTMIVYSTVAGSVSIAALFMAGYIPGIIWGAGVIILATTAAKRLGYRSSSRADP